MVIDDHLGDIAIERAALSVSQAWVVAESDRVVVPDIVLGSVEVLEPVRRIAVRAGVPGRRFAIAPGASPC